MNLSIFAVRKNIGTPASSRPGSPSGRRRRSKGSRSRSHSRDVSDQNLSKLVVITKKWGGLMGLPWIDFKLKIYLFNN